MAMAPGLCSRIFDATRYQPGELALIERIIRFDRDFYLAEYPDVAQAEIDPLVHYLSQGVNELRLPAGQVGSDWLAEALGFDAAFYAAMYPDTAADPAGHLVANGMREQRLPFDLGCNLAAEQLLARVMDRLDLRFTGHLEACGQLDAAAWQALPAALAEAAAREDVTARPYRNNFWLAMAMGHLARGSLGAAACCYNFFFNGYVPVRWLGNTQDRLIGVGRISTTERAIVEDGMLIAMPEVAVSVRVAEPVFLNRANRPGAVTELALPRPIYGILTDVEVIGGSSIIISGGHEVLYDYAEPGAGEGQRAREMQSPSMIHVAGEHCSYRLPSQVIEVDEAFSMLHDHAHNYHHWLLEVLPRYLLARQHGLSDAVPLLVQGQMAPQCHEVLRRVAGRVPLLVEVPRGVSARVGRLHWMTDICVNSVHTAHEPRHCDILFSPSAVQMLRDLAAPLFADLGGKYENVLIIRRNVSFRRLINRSLLEMSLKALGMWGFDPGGASWAKQVRVFSNARFIVSEAGAALANMVFCRPGATMIVLVQGHRNSNYYYLAQLADLVGVRLFFFECLRLEGSHEIGVQEDMIAPLAPLSAWIARFVEDPNYQPVVSGDLVLGPRPDALAA